MRAGVSWFDFSGNAHNIAPGIRVIVDGRPNQVRTRGRPASAFAPKSSRVARYLLMHPGEAVIQRDIAQASGVSEGFVSRIVARLEEERYVIREESGAPRVKNPHRLLDAWRDEYRFSKHTTIQGHVAARSGDELARLARDKLKAQSVAPSTAEARTRTPGEPGDRGASRTPGKKEQRAVRRVELWHGLGALPLDLLLAEAFITAGRLDRVGPPR